MPRRTARIFTVSALELRSPTLSRNCWRRSSGCVRSHHDERQFDVTELRFGVVLRGALFGGVVAALQEQEYEDVEDDDGDRRERKIRPVERIDAALSARFDSGGAILRVPLARYSRLRASIAIRN